MRIFIYLYILKLIAHTESATNPKAVNVQLETVLEFNDKDKDADVKFIGNIQKILKKVKIALSPETGRRSLSKNYINNNKQIEFTDFILAAIDILLVYDDDDLENAFSILDDEIRKYHYKGCKFYELVEDENVRKFVATTLDDLKKKKAKTLRKKLFKVINIIGNAKLISSHRKFVEYINSLYRYESSKTFMNILQNLQNYSYKSKRSNMNLIEMTRNGIRSVLFDYFSKLNPNVRKNIKKNIIENTWSYNKNSKQKQTDEYNDNDSVHIIADETTTYYNSIEDKKEGSSSVSNEDNSHIKINILNEYAGKKKHPTIRHAIENKQSFLTQRPVKNTIKQIDQEYTTKELKLKSLWNERSAKETSEQNNAELKAHSFEREERKEKKKRNKQNKIKTNVENTKNIEDDVRVEKKRKKNKRQKFKAIVEKAKSVEDTVIVKEETRNNLRSESSLTRLRTESHEDVFNNFNELDEKRHSDQDLETKSLPYKRKKPIKRKQFTKPTMKLNIHSLSDEGMSIEDEHYRRKMKNDYDSEIDEEEDDKRHKASAEIIRKHFMTRINNLEKQMEEIGRKVDNTPTNDDVYEIEIETTEKKAESSTDSSNQDSNIYLPKTWYNGGIKDKLNVTVKNITNMRTTLSYHIIIGPEYIPPKNNTNDKIPGTEVKTDTLNITDNGKTNINNKENLIDIEDAPFLTDYDYSEAKIMKKLNITFTLSEEKPKSNDRIIEEKPKSNDRTIEEKPKINERIIEEKLKINERIIEEKPKSNERITEEKPRSNERIIEKKPVKRVGDKIKVKETGLHRIDIPVDIDNEIVQNNKIDERKIDRFDIIKKNNI